MLAWSLLIWQARASGNVIPRKDVLRIVRALPLLLVGLALVGCAREYIPNTQVDDNPFNRRVIEYCEAYRKAVERRNTAELIQMAHPTYYEDGGNIDATDDLDFAGLEEYLESKFADTKAIRYEIRYRRVTHGRADEVFVDYTYSASYKIPTEKGDIWRRTVAENRLELVPDDAGESFKIIAGM
jgi:hypothetical protein